VAQRCCGAPARMGKRSCGKLANKAKNCAQRCVTKPFLVIFVAKIVRNVNGSCYACATLRWEPIIRTVGITGSQKVNFLQKRSAKIYVFALLSPFAPFLARFRLVFVSFSARPGPTLKTYPVAQPPFFTK